MARYYGIVQNERGSKATGCGHKSIDVTAASRDGAVRVYLWNATDGSVRALVELIQWAEPGREKRGTMRPLYLGPVSGDDPSAGAA
jgi:hypothetical protein